jgi:hypothetical protein
MKIAGFTDEGRSAMTNLKGFVASVASVAFATMAVLAPTARAQESSTDEKTSRFTFDGAFSWMGTWGHDVPVAETITVDEGFEPATGRVTMDENINRLIAEMRNENVPWAQFGFERGKWGISAEFWMLDTSGTTGTGDDPFEAFRYHEFLDTDVEAALDVTAEDQLSVWAARVLLLRALSKSLTLGVGFHAAELENRRKETLELSEISDFLPQAGAVVVMDSNNSGVLVGPSVDVRGSAKIGERVRVRFTGAQSVLFATLEQQAKWRSTITYGSDYFSDSTEVLTLASSTRVAIPVTDARAILSFDLGGHVSVGVFGLLSIWFDAPLALRFSYATDGWDEASSTLVFASAGPMVTIRF